MRAAAAPEGKALRYNVDAATIAALEHGDIYAMYDGKVAKAAAKFCGVADAQKRKPAQVEAAVAEHSAQAEELERCFEAASAGDSSHPTEQYAMDYQAMKRRKRFPFHAPLGHCML